MTDGPGTEWTNAFHTIQGAVDAAKPGDSVLVTNGIYDLGSALTPEYTCPNRVCITNNITLQGVNGPENTFIVGAGENGPSAVRCVYMTAGILSGFTITNGHTFRTGNSEYDRSGGGINMLYDGSSGSGLVTNCILAGNSANVAGGGSCYGMFSNCIFTANVTDSSGGACYESVLSDCVLSGNESGYAGGGAYGGTLNRCLLTGNTADWAGGGSSRADLSNCLLTDNEADYGGGSHYGNLNNCTITENTAHLNGGGNYYGTLNNCIIWSNTANNGTNTYGGTFSNSCMPALEPGTGNITNPPLFMAAATGDYHLQSSSLCIDAGNNAYAVGPTDLDGTDRIVNTVDMGVYEYIHSPDNYDGDNYSNLEEQIADTDPVDNTDYFRIGAITNTTVYFHSATGRIYTLFWKSNLLEESWSYVSEHVGAGGPDSIQTTNQALTGAFQLIVEMQVK